MDDFLPGYDFHEVHSIRIHAPSERIFRAIRAATTREIRFVQALLGIRALPARLLGRSRAPAGADKPILENALNSGFLLLAEEDTRELVLGAIGQFWKLLGGDRLTIGGPQEFVAFERPGYVKVTMNFYAEAEGGGWSRLSTETRIRATDAAARRKFARYWRVIYPGSALIRRMWLRAVKKRAEKQESHG